MGGPGAVSQLWVVLALSPLGSPLSSVAREEGSGQILNLKLKPAAL